MTRHNAVSPMFLSLCCSYLLNIPVAEYRWQQIMVSSSEYGKECFGIRMTTKTRCCPPSCYHFKSYQAALKLCMALLTTQDTMLR